MAADGRRNLNLLVLPFPLQGHISPSLAFSKFLASKGLNITILSTSHLTKSAKDSLSSSSINIQAISDGSEDDDQDRKETTEEMLTRFKRCVSQNLANFLDEKMESGSVARAIIYDSCLPWVLDIARGRGLLAASFFTQSCSVCAVYYHLKINGLLKFPDTDRVVSMPALPRLEAGELPFFPKVMDPNNTVMNFLTDQFSNLEEVDWIFFNTFDKLEYEVIEWMSRRWPIKTIGPTISLSQTNEVISDQKNDHMISIFEPTDEEACIEWLNLKEANSVLYVSFGSVAALPKEQMEELAFGLIMSNCDFLWVVRLSEESKLPPDFISNVRDGGLIVKWCSQPRILAHPAVSCFMTHCGWNSFLEALSCSVPMIGMAQWGDQHTNAKFIEDVWNVGVRIPGDVKREEVAKVVAEVVHGDKGKELKRNACKWKELVEEAVGKNGSSTKNVDDFVSLILGG